MKRFLNQVEQFQKQTNLSKTGVSLVAFSILLFLSLALTLPNYLLKKKVQSQTALAAPSTLTPQVLDALLFTDKPDLSSYGIKPGKTVYTQELWPSGSPNFNIPNENGIRAEADTVWNSGYRGSVALDLESSPLWPYDVCRETSYRGKTEAQVIAGIDKYKQEVP